MEPILMGLDDIIVVFDYAKYIHTHEAVIFSYSY